MTLGVQASSLLAVLFVGLYISVITGVVTASIISTIFISQLHHRGAVYIPHKLRRFTFDFMARLVFLPDLAKAHGTLHHLGSFKSESWSSASSTRTTSNIKLKSLNGVHHGHLEPEDTGTQKEEVAPDIRWHNNLLRNTNVHLEHIIESLKEYEQRRIDSETVDYMKAEWQSVGKVYDRFFFIIFVIVMSIITIIFLLPTSGSEEWNYEEADFRHG